MILKHVIIGIVFFGFIFSSVMAGEANLVTPFQSTKHYAPDQINSRVIDEQPQRAAAKIEKEKINSEGR
jgi:predicted nucleic acid-binding protein